MLYLYHETVYSVQKLYTFLNCYIDTQNYFKNKKIKIQHFLEGCMYRSLLMMATSKGQN